MIERLCTARVITFVSGRRCCQLGAQSVEISAGGANQDAEVCLIRGGVQEQSRIVKLGESIGKGPNGSRAQVKLPTKGPWPPLRARCPGSSRRASRPSLRRSRVGVLRLAALPAIRFKVRRPGAPA